MGLFGKKKNKEEAIENKNARIKILGDSCSKCDELEKNVRLALDEMNLDIEVGHVTNFVEIAKFGVMQTPALVIDERVVKVGSVITKSEIIEIFKKEF